MTFSQERLDERIIKALKPNLGRRLTAVEYCMWEKHPTDINSPDYELFWGAIRLTFDGERQIWVDWAYWPDEWGGTQLYVAAENKYENERLHCLDAGSVDVWHSVIGARLNRFDILSAYGPDHAVRVPTGEKDEPLASVFGQPHGLRLSFSAGSVLVGVANDGDDEFGWGEAVIVRPDDDPYLGQLRFILWSSDA